LSELDEAWALALAEAEAHARASGRKDISEYLALRNSNDLLRKTGSDWLLKMFTTVAGEANRSGAGIQISREDLHRFKVGNASMVGRSLSLVNGVRVLKIELGWPRTPRDGFIRGGGLACGNINHLGIKSASRSLRLVLSPGGTPQWTMEGKRGEHAVIHEQDIRQHVTILLSDSQPHTKHS
jgi:hypothetical protein